MDGEHTSCGLTGPQKGNRQAFTLVELLVVIAILALLIAILLPVAGRIRTHARAVACQSNLRQWGLLLNTYVAGNDGKFFLQMTHVDKQTEPELATVWVQSWWYVFLTDFGNYRDIWLCPMATARPADGQTGSTFRAWRAERCAERLPERGWGVVEREFLGSYGVNGWVGLSRHPEPERPNTACWTTPYAKGAATVPLVFDCRCSIYYGTLDDPPPGPDADTTLYYTAATSAWIVTRAGSTPYSWIGRCEGSASNGSGVSSGIRSTTRPAPGPSQAASRQPTGRSG